MRLGDGYDIHNVLKNISEDFLGAPQPLRYGVQKAPKTPFPSTHRGQRESPQMPLQRRLLGDRGEGGRGGLNGYNVQQETF